MLRLIVLLLMFILSKVDSKSTKEFNCPVCIRIMETVKTLVKDGGNNEKDKNVAAKAYNNYCSIQELSVDDAKFCYDTENIRNEILRLFELGADSIRICKRVAKLNPDFCYSSSKTKEALEDSKDNKLKRGIIYI